MEASKKRCCFVKTQNAGTLRNAVSAAHLPGSYSRVSGHILQ